MQTIQEILNFSIGKLTVGNIIFAIAIFIVCHMVIKALMGPINKLLDKLSFDKTLRSFLQAAIKVILNFVAVCIVAESVGIPISSLLAVLGMFGFGKADGYFPYSLPNLPARAEFYVDGTPEDITKSDSWISYTLETTYTVQKGDSLYSIAKKFNTTVATLKELNNLTSNLLSIGQILIVR